MGHSMKGKKVVSLYHESLYGSLSGGLLTRVVGACLCLCGRPPYPHFALALQVEGVGEGGVTYRDLGGRG